MRFYEVVRRRVGPSVRLRNISNKTRIATAVLVETENTYRILTEKYIQ